MSKRGLVDAKAAGVTPMTRTVSPASAGVLQRKCACGQHAVGGECAECRKKQEGAALQRKPADADRDVDTVPPIVYDVLRGSGRPLDHETRAFMEPRFGHDFSGVRVHTGGRAAESARAVNALAYTVGRDVVFGEGQYVPGAGEGRRLLAHELTHVVQQSRSHADTRVPISLSQDAFLEGTADQVSNRIEGATSSRDAAGDVESRAYPGSSPNSSIVDSFNIGSADVIPKLSVGSQTTLQTKACSELGKRFESINMPEMGKRLFLMHQYTTIQGEFNEIVADIEYITNEVGLGYDKASERFLTAHGDQAKHDAAMVQLMGSVLAVASAGALAWLGESTVLISLFAGLEKFNTQVLEDLAQATSGEVFSAVMPAFIVASPNTVSITPDPSSKYSEINELVYELKKSGLGVLSRLNTSICEMTAKQIAKLDLTKAQVEFEEWATRAKNAVQGGRNLKIESISKELERGMWAKWLPRLRGTVLDYEIDPDTHDIIYDVPPTERTVFSDPGGNIEKRLDALGITKESGVGDFGWWTSDSEVNLIVTWATNYRVTEFLNTK